MRGVHRQAPFAEALIELGHRRPDVVVLSADLAKYTDVQPFAEAFPDRFFQVGMAEQNMMGVAGGLAKGGFLPIAVTYGVFAARRAYDQVAMALCTGASRGVVVAFLPGITTPFRATHQAVDDLALMRALPGICVIDPADATELKSALVASVEYDRTVYIRGQRGLVAQLFDPSDFEFRIGSVRLLLDGENRGSSGVKSIGTTMGDGASDSRVGLIGTGLGSQWALEAADLLAARGVFTSLLHVPTLKPVDRDAIADFCARFPVVTTIENHSTVGGLATVVAESMAAAGIGTRLHALGVPDRWADAGSLDHVRRQLRLDAESIASAVEGR